jgi:hypothetical protein
MSAEWDELRGMLRMLEKNRVRIWVRADGAIEFEGVEENCPTLDADAIEQLRQGIERGVARMRGSLH